MNIPETVTKAVDRLLLVLSDNQKAEIVAMKEDDLIDLHSPFAYFFRRKQD